MATHADVSTIAKNETGWVMSSIRDIDRGWRNFKLELGNIDKSFTKVGVQQGTIHKSKAGEVGLSDMVVIAAANEFGTRTIPSRPFMRRAFQRNLTKLNDLIGSTYGSVITGRLSTRRGLAIIGEFMTSEIKREITILRRPPNAPATIARKGSSNPLIDTGQLRASIAHVEVIR